MRFSDWGVMIRSPELMKYQEWMVFQAVCGMQDGVTPGQPVYQAQYVDAGARTEADGTGDGVHVESIALGPAQGQDEYQPTNPVVTLQGAVAVPPTSALMIRFRSLRSPSLN